MKYQFPCERCGQTLLIDVSQAGQQVVCGCGASLEVPSLRLIRALPPASDVPSKSRRPTWDRGRGVLFAAGVLIAILGLLVAGAAAAGWMTSQRPIAPSPQDIEAAVAGVSELSAPRAWDLWADMRSQGLGQYMEPPHSQYQAYVRHVLSVFLVGAALLATGIAAVAISIRLPRRAAPRPPTR